ncbi:MAG: hypothetical protein KF845_04970 [Cyclobacteriaceae bacterium]|nr:hypothetical protein [Cyclobacteriaceae bacterium]
MKQLMCLAIVAFSLTGCEIKVEIPVEKAGVVITNNGEVKEQVLRSGKQVVRTDSKVILYDINYQQVENDFDFLFKDVSSGDVKLTIEFTPVIDSLPGFYKAYKSIYIDPVVDVKSRSTVRRLLENYNPIEFSKDEFKTKIIEALNNNREITDYVKVHKVEVVDLKW